jgi:hypothetical protein
VIHAHLIAKVSLPPQRRSGRDGEAFLRVRADARSAGRSVRCVLELRGRDLNRAVNVGDEIEAMGQVLPPAYIDCAKPFSACVVRVERLLRITSTVASAEAGATDLTAADQRHSDS